MAAKVIPYKHKGQDVFICGGSTQRMVAKYAKLAIKKSVPCGTVVENLNATEFFPNGYHYDTCPNCGQELDYNDPVKIERTKFKPTDYEVIAKWANEKSK